MRKVATRCCLSAWGWSGPPGWRKSWTASWSSTALNAWKLRHRQESRKTDASTNPARKAGSLYRSLCAEKPHWRTGGYLGRQRAAALSLWFARDYRRYPGSGERPQGGRLPGSDDSTGDGLRRIPGRTGTQGAPLAVRRGGKPGCGYALPDQFR